jgi:catechol 2,3-dioxygenase-like lactoylglutathione lyase family enzyme
MTLPALNWLGVKALALGVGDLERALRFYTVTLSLPLAYEDGQPVGVRIGQTLLFLKADWHAPPSALLNPRVTLQTADARATEAALRALGVVIADPVAVYGQALVGSFLDSEGNKLWYCSEPEAG